MKNGNISLDNKFGATFTFGLVLRGELQDINLLIDFLKTSNLVVAHQKIGQQKMWIKQDGEH